MGCPHTKGVQLDGRKRRWWKNASWTWTVSRESGGHGLTGCSWVVPENCKSNWAGILEKSKKNRDNPPNTIFNNF